MTSWVVIDDTERIRNNMDDFIMCKYGDQQIRQRKSDGYFYATEMASLFKKRWSNYYANNNTNEYLEALSTTTGIPVLSLIQAKNGGASGEHGTWIHPRVASHFAMWLSPKFAVQVTDWIDRYMRGDISLVADVVARHDQVHGMQSNVVIESKEIDDPFDEKESVLIKRRRIYNELDEQEARTKRIRYEAERMRIETNQMLLAMFDNDEMVDERTKILLHDFKLRNIQESMTSNKNLLTNGPSNSEISIPMISQKYHLRYSPEKSSQIGIAAARMYRNRHNKSPPKRTAWFQGRPIKENTYYESDEDILRLAIMMYANNRNDEEYDSLSESLSDLLKRRS